MASFTDTISLVDQMSPVLLRIANQALEAAAAARDLQHVADDPIANRAFEQMLSNLDASVTELNQLEESMAGVQRGLAPVEDGFRGWKQAVTGVNQAMQLVSTAVNRIQRTFQGMVDASSDAVEAETRLLTILGANTGVSREQYAQLQRMTAQYSQMTTFSEAALTAGLSELATYRLSADALEAMLGTLTDYAAGQGGVNVNSQQMINLANQLGKALDGNYGGLTRIGFALDEHQKSIIDTGTEMERVAVIAEVIGQSYGGLAAALADTPLGQAQALENAWGNVRQELGDRLMAAIGNVNRAQRNLLEVLQPEAAAWFYDAFFFGAQLATSAIAGVINMVSWLIDRFNSGDKVVRTLFFTVLGAGAVAAVSSLTKIGIAGVKWGMATSAAWLPVILPFLKIGMIIGAVILLLDAMGATGETIAGAIGGAFSAMGAIIHNIIAGIYNAFMWVANQISRVVSWFTGNEAAQFEYKEYRDLGEAFDAGRESGRDFYANNLEGLLNFSPMGLDDSLFREGIPHVGNVDEIGRIRDPVNLADEDLRYLLDERERRFVANVNLNSPAPSLSVVIENVNGVADLDDVGNYLGNILREKMESSAVLVPL